MSRNRRTTDDEISAESADDVQLQSLRVAWAEVIGELRATPQVIEQALHSRGILTMDDLRRNPTTALSAIQACYALDLQVLMQRAEEYAKRTKES